MKPGGVLAVAAAALAAGCGSSHNRIPDVRFQTFPTALSRLRTDGYLVRVPYFPPIRRALPEQGYGTLGDYVVAGESPPPGARAHADATVTLLVSLRLFEGPLGSIVGRNDHPARTRVPDLAGRTYADAMSGDVEQDGLWRRVEWVAPLEGQASADGLGAFQVGRQRPAAGTSVPFAGVPPGGAGVEPRLSTVTIDLGDAEAAMRADASARPAIAAARRSAVFRALRHDFLRFGRPTPPGAATFRCDLGRTRAAGLCLTAVDPIGPHPLVVFAETWHDRTERGTATGPLRSRTWRVRL